MVIAETVETVTPLHTALQWTLVVMIIILVILGLIIGFKKLQGQEPSKKNLTKLKDLSEKELLVTLIMLRDPDEDDLQKIIEKVQQ